MSHWILIGCCISHLPGSKCSCRLHFLEAIMQLCGQWCQTSASALKKCGHLTIQNTVMLCCCRSADNNAQVTSKRRVIQVATATVRPVVRYQCSQKIIWLFSISICRYLVAAEVLTIMLEVTSKSRVAAQVLSLADVQVDSTMSTCWLPGPRPYRWYRGGWRQPGALTKWWKSRKELTMVVGRAAQAPLFVNVLALLSLL